MTAQWCDDYHHAAHVALTGETEGYYADFASLESLSKTWTGGFFHDGTYSSFRGREHGAPLPPDVPAWRLVTFAQDHDQIGNRATGDRLSEVLSTDRLAVAAVLSLCSPYTPMIFMGEEWAASTPWQFFTGHPEPELAAATAEGRVAEFAEHGLGHRRRSPTRRTWRPSERSHLDWSRARPRTSPPHPGPLSPRSSRCADGEPDLGGTRVHRILSAEVRRHRRAPFAPAAGRRSRCWSISATPTGMPAPARSCSRHPRRSRSTAAGLVHADRTRRSWPRSAG